MRKIGIATLSLLLLITTFAFAGPSIRVLSPDPQNPHSDPTPWFAGETHQIRWSTGRSASRMTVNIYLMEPAGKRVIQTIARNVSGSPLRTWYTWHIPTTLSTGEYRIRVASSNRRIYGDSASFRIFNIPVDQRITVTYPNLSVQRLYRNTRYVIRWNPCEGLRCDTVNIYLITESGSIAHTIATGVAARAREWGGILAPASVPYGRYRIKVETTDNTGYGTSPDFEVTDPPEIHAFSPSPGSTLYLGHTYLIEWNSTPVVTGTITIYANITTLQNKKVRLQLYRGANTHSFSWHLDPRTVPPGHGYIVIYNDKFNVGDTIRNITIKRLKTRPIGPVDLKKIPWRHN